MPDHQRAASERSFEAEVSSLKSSFDRLLETFETAHRADGANAANPSNAMARRYMMQARAALDRLGNEVESVAKEQALAAISTLDAGTRKIETAIRDRPLTSVAVAFGVGCVLSLLVRRR